MNLATRISEHSKDVSRTLEQFFDSQTLLAKDIDSHLLTSLQELRTFVLRGGKTLRPFLVEVAYALAGGPSNTHLIMAASATELHHKHILILDDIADRDETRYSGPTLEYAYRELFKNTNEQQHRSLSFAMLDSVWLGALARELLIASKFDADKIIACHHILDTIMYRDTLAGWQIHALQCDQPISQATPEEFVKGLELVTARYTFEGPFKIGLILASNTDTKLEKALTLYSQKVGTAFQIHDDILGLFGDSKKTGKPVGNDIREGKKTLLLQIAYQHCGQDEQDFLEAATGKKDVTEKEIERVREIVTHSGSLTYSQELELQMAKDGINALHVLPESEEKELLAQLAMYIVTREK